jgi:hypothetical protein
MRQLCAKVKGPRTFDIWKQSICQTPPMLATHLTVQMAMKEASSLTRQHPLIVNLKLQDTAHISIGIADTCHPQKGKSGTIRLDTYFSTKASSGLADI